MDSSKLVPKTTTTTITLILLLKLAFFRKEIFVQLGWKQFLVLKRLCRSTNDSLSKDLSLFQTQEILESLVRSKAFFIVEQILIPNSQWPPAIPKNVSFDENLLFRLAASSNKLNLTRWLLSDDNPEKQKIIPNANGNEAINRAMELGHIEMVKYLISIRPIYPEISAQSYSFVLCCSRGHLEMAKFVLENCDTNPVLNSINPAGFENEALRLACKGGHIEVVKLLNKFKSKFPAIQIEVRQNKALRWAARG